MTISLKDVPCAYRVSVKGLVRDANGGLLLVRERSDTWDLPGGGLDHGETITDALRREFREELAVDIAIQHDSCHAIATWSQKFDIPVLLVIYMVTLQNPPQLTDEVAECRFVSLAEAKLLSLDTTLQHYIDEIYRKAEAA